MCFCGVRPFLKHICIKTRKRGYKFSVEVGQRQFGLPLPSFLCTRKSHFKLKILFRYFHITYMIEVGQWQFGPPVFQNLCTKKSIFLRFCCDFSLENRILLGFCGQFLSFAGGVLLNPFNGQLGSFLHRRTPGPPPLFGRF